MQIKMMMMMISALTMRSPNNVVCRLNESFVCTSITFVTLDKLQCVAAVPLLVKNPGSATVFIEVFMKND